MYFLARMTQQFLILRRDVDGMATTRHATRQVWAPELWKYPVDYTVKSDIAGGARWGLCIVPDDAVIPAAVASDPDIIALPTNRTRPLDSTDKTALDSQLTTTDLPTRVQVSETTSDLVQRIVRGPLRHTTAFVG